MPPLSVSWLRGWRGVSSTWITPAQRAVRVLQVTRANWPVLPAGRRRKQRGGTVAAPPSVRDGEENSDD